MMEKDKIIEDIIKRLNSDQDTEVLKALDDARNKASIAVLPAVIEVYLTHKSMFVHDKAKALVYDTKLPEGLSYLIHQLQKEQDDTKQGLLVAAIWEAGYSAEDHLEYLIELALSASFETLIEIFTVIDNIDAELDQDLVMDLNLSITEWMDEHSDSPKNTLLFSISEILNEKIA